MDVIDHDRLFKELLTTFFVEFIDAFLPAVGAALDHETALVPLDKEIFTDVTQGEKHEVDVLMQARFPGQDAFFLIHVENQATPQADFPKRMFRYFARLTEKYDLPVYPVVIFSYDAPQRPEPNRFVVAFPQETVLRFQYKVIQLNRLSWRKFVRQPNPAATALMAKMKIASSDRVRVRLECLRLLRTLKLDPARSQLIWGFVETYLTLNAEEMRRYERATAQLTSAEQEQTMEQWTSIGRQAKAEGLALGLQEGKEALVARLIRRRFGTVPEKVVARLDQLSPEQLDDLGEALLDFVTVTDLDQWFLQHS